MLGKVYRVVWVGCALIIILNGFLVRPEPLGIKLAILLIGLLLAGYIVAFEKMKGRL